MGPNRSTCCCLRQTHGAGGCREASSCSCVPSGIFREVVISRKGAYSCPVASGVIFAVNVDVRGAAGAPVDAHSQALLASMQARRPHHPTGLPDELVYQNCLAHYFCFASFFWQYKCEMPISLYQLQSSCLF